MPRTTPVVTAILAVCALTVSALPQHGVTGTASAAAAPVAADTGAVVRTEAQLRAAWADPLRRRIDLGADIALHNCAVGDPIRESPYPMVVDGHGHVIRQTCFEKRLLRQDGTGYLELHDLTLTRGGADGPGAAVTSRGEISIFDSVIKQNLSEEPGGGVFSMRRVTVHRSRINGNLANDDGGGVYARRGGVEVYDSVLSTNLVDGSGGAIGSTGDITVVRSEVDGNTTDGDGGALYTDEDGDVTVVDSLIDGSDADGPGGAIFTLDGDVAVLNSTLIGNRADDRGGAISGEADVLLVNSTVARNLAVAHAGGGVWARGNLMLLNSTVTDNYAEGDGGGTLSAGRTTLINSTLTRNIASVGGNVGSSGRLFTRSSIIGPATTTGVTGDTIPTRRICRVYDAVSSGYNFVTDQSCDLDDDRDIQGPDPELSQLEDDPRGFVLLPQPGSPVLGRVPAGTCVPELPTEVPAGQLLAPYVDWPEILRHDAVGTPRDDGRPCDIGAVEYPTVQDPDPEPGARAVQDRAPSFRKPTRSPAATEESGFSLDLLRGTTARPVPPSGALVRLDRRLRSLEQRALGLQRAGNRFDVLQRCTVPLGVDQIGDPQHRYGLLYDERDGTGVDTRTALAPHPGGTTPDLQLLRLSRSRTCLSRPTDPNGSGANARVVPTGSGTITLASLRRLLHLLELRVARVDAVTGRFDDWESCLSWLPVTEDGDARQDLGFVSTSGDPGTRRHVPAIDLDSSEWDDPDYQLLAFTGANRPNGKVECQTEPGEASDRVIPRTGSLARLLARAQGRSKVAPARDRARAAQSARVATLDLADLRERADDAEEDLDDLAEPVSDITRFDECMYTVGVRRSGGYAYRDQHGVTSARSAFSFDLRGLGLPEYDVMAFPGEEPPQIECNEDAGGEDTEE